MASGTGTDSVGPIVVDESRWAQIGHFPWASWTIVPDPARIDAHELGTMITAWPRFGDALLQADTGSSGYSQDGQFLLTAAALTSRVRAVDALTPMVPLTLAVIALVSILELARLLGEIRSAETELLWSRGASPASWPVRPPSRPGSPPLSGAILGTIAAVAVLAFGFGPEAIGAAGAAVWAVPLGATAVATLVFGIQAFRASRLSARRDVPERSGRGGRLARLGIVVLLAIATVLSVWQLQLYGSPVTPSATGGEVDPVTVLAPALMLVSLVSGRAAPVPGHRAVRRAMGRPAARRGCRPRHPQRRSPPRARSHTPRRRRPRLRPVRHGRRLLGELGDVVLDRAGDCDPGRRSESVRT